MREINPELRTRAESLGIKILGTWGEAKVHEECGKVYKLAQEGNGLDVMGMPVETNPELIKFHTLEWANERAAKIWDGQSPNLGIAERVGRIRAALKVRGFTKFDELVIPTTENYKIYL